MTEKGKNIWISRLILGTAVSMAEAAKNVWNIYLTLLNKAD
jgi:hypothetical protein